MSFIKFEVGDVKTIFLRHDNWHPIGTLSLEFGYRVIYDAASKPEAKVESVLRDKVWIWKPAKVSYILCVSNIKTQQSGQ